MKTKLLLFSVMLTSLAFAQAPVVYINFVSHNEPGDQLNSSANFSAMNTKVLQLAAIIDTSGVYLIRIDNKHVQKIIKE